ncbi:MAG TPA: hypothetical protein VIJ20_14440, partial [Solirubrobacteraceae bacterium]
GVVLRKDCPLTQTQHGLAAGALRAAAEIIHRALAAIAAGQRAVKRITPMKSSGEASRVRERSEPTCQQAAA